MELILGLHSYKTLSKEHTNKISLSGCIHTVDADPLKVELCREFLNMETNEQNIQYRIEIYSCKRQNMNLN